MSVRTQICYSDNHPDFGVEWRWCEDVRGLKFNFDCPVCCEKTIPWTKKYLKVERKEDSD